eukprot:Tbor_TRINITY_DN5515_c3_g3::TRINITY_DN5515_c3_g3_i1::g.13415::m.13415/K00898/PDK2_3_4; pyruvate dehydrogenase kinase 2/3/4
MIRHYCRYAISASTATYDRGNNTSITSNPSSVTLDSLQRYVQVRTMSKGHSPDVPSAVLMEIKRRIEESSDKTLATYNQRNHIRKLIDFYASMKLIDVDLNKIVVWMDNPTYDPYIFCHRQLPVLLAHLVKSMGMLPCGLSSMSNISETNQLLVESFTKLLNHPIPTTLETEKSFAKLLEELDNKHSEFNILVKMAVGVMELKTHLLRHKDAIYMLRSRIDGTSKTVCGSNVPSNFRLPSVCDKHSTDTQTLDSDETTYDDKYAWSKSHFTEELLTIQDPIDRLNKILIQYNFISRQMIDFAHRVEQINMDTANGKSSSKTHNNGSSNTDGCSCMNTPRPDFKMCQQVSLKDVVKEAVQDAREICDSQYGDTPDVEYEFISEPLVPGVRQANMSAVYSTPKKSYGHLVTGSNELQKQSRGVVSGSDGSLIYAHIVPTVHYIVVELMKNAFRATIERHMKRNASGMISCTDMPPVKVTMNARPGLEHSCISVTDRGNGIKRSDMQLVMSYSFSTANNVLECSVDKDTVDFKPPTHSHVFSSVGSDCYDAPPMEGYGYGLPMSRAYARSFGGDMLLQSVEGYGTKASLYLQAC